MSDYATILEQQYHTLKYVAQLEALIPAGSLPDRPPEMPPRPRPPVVVRRAALSRAGTFPDRPPEIPPRPGPPVVVDVPSITGEGEVGAVLTCTMGNWEGTPTSYAYDWDAMGADTSSVTYTVDVLDAGGSITCVV